MSLLFYKSLAAISIFLLTLVAGLLPLRVALRNKQILHLGDAFAGGIFLSAALLHLLPDAEAGFTKLHSTAAGLSGGGGGDAYPVAQLICAISFVLLLLMEKGLVIYGKYRTRIFVNGSDNTSNNNASSKHAEEGGDAKQHAATTATSNNSSHTLAERHQHDAHSGICCHDASCTCMGSISENKSNDDKGGKHSSNKNIITPYLLLLILSVHSFIEGSAIGISGSLAGMLVIYLAVIAHKCSESLALTSNLYRYDIKIKHICWLIFVFSLLTPLGIFLASLVENMLHLAANGNLFEATFDAIAAGTFLYLGTVHIMECKKSFEDFGEITALILGITLMAVVALWV